MTTLASPIERAVEELGASVLDGMTDAELDALWYDWQLWARPNQLPPGGDWITWLIMAGRGFGKTRTGSEWIRRRVHEGAQRIALVGRTPGDVRDVMVEGESGILAVFPEAEKPLYEPSKRRITFHTGAIATVYSSENPDQLRGPQHDTAYCDELATFKTSEAWDNLQMGLRLGQPRQIVTTTPRPVRVLRDLIDLPDTVVTRGTTYENRSNLADAFFRQVIRRYEGTHLGQQELQGLLLDSVPGALWSREMLQYREPPDLVRVVVGVDPSVSESDNAAECGIVVAGEGTDGNFYVLRDASLRASPYQWSQRAVQAREEYGADWIIAEGNQGGELVRLSLRTVDPDAPVRVVYASVGKYARAEPVSALYEQGRVYHAESFIDLEDQMCTWTAEDGPSPDRLDALVWALTELGVSRRRPQRIAAPQTVELRG